ncbi:GCN5 family N-acetyltransferase [Asanoa ishikariensis]|uniref:N-acetylglutamate synthase, GNAT family n=1 Tax=Asanoa ishikariensis TaxID=137265 RepID=A0A1H3KHM4_9ACTN|nr:GNAT family N-acetyltransferase [Asanoa ishikariensis]GIF69897.1 GCN5 family N-acetyltransferase [Asanoa ishikariensis]SDY51275.1 N-acetylglutamate synthase, GNAT family [Asanoa ishikariensis]
MRIRKAQQNDLATLQDIERAAGEAFRGIGMPEIADDEPPTTSELEGYLQAGTAWVMTVEDDVVAYLIAEPIDGNLHIEQVSVHPDHAGKRLGRQLIEHAAAEATANGMPALTLTTFRDVPWNAPYYERCGFHTIPDDELTPGLEAKRQQEADHGLDRWTRVCMRRPTIS